MLEPPLCPLAEPELRRALSKALLRSVREGRVGLPPFLTPAPPAPAKPEKRFARIARAFPRAALRFVLLAHAFYILTTSILICAYSVVTPPVTVLAGYRKFANGWKLAKPRPVKLKNVVPLARRMVISIEDGKFYSHWGLDFEAFERAIEINKRINRPMYGGSTLTMQTARTLFLIPFKSYLRKYLEIIVALELELFLSKNRILELYLSWAEWGKGIFGIDAAARAYYKIGSANLGFDQSARIAALLSSPIRFSPSTIEKSPLLRSRYNYLVQAYGQ